ncbi:hypothetical protein KC351_g109 [Hortaea werneckii]|nr:hypothetical protein KC351_g109 [Hortaea werneckii]
MRYQCVRFMRITQGPASYVILFRFIDHGRDAEFDGIGSYTLYIQNVVMTSHVCFKVVKRRRSDVPEKIYRVNVRLRSERAPIQFRFRVRVKSPFSAEVVEPLCLRIGLKVYPQSQLKKLLLKGPPCNGTLHDVGAIQTVHTICSNNSMLSFACAIALSDSPAEIFQRTPKPGIDLQLNVASDSRKPCRPPSLYHACRLSKRNGRSHGVR